MDNLDTGTSAVKSHLDSLHHDIFRFVSLNRIFYCTGIQYYCRNVCTYIYGLKICFKYWCGCLATQLLFPLFIIHHIVSMGAQVTNHKHFKGLQAWCVSLTRHYIKNAHVMGHETTQWSNLVRKETLLSPSSICPKRLENEHQQNTLSHSVKNISAEWPNKQCKHVCRVTIAADSSHKPSCALSLRGT